MSIAVLGGIIWNVFGYQYVFLMGVGIAAINFFVAWQIRIPKNAGTGTRRAELREITPSGSPNPIRGA